jgi:hypothetical protein
MSDETVPSEATTAVTVPEELLPKRGPGRPLGASKDRVSSIDASIARAIRSASASRR